MSKAARSKVVDLDLTVKHATDKAILVTNLKGKDVWLAKSQIDMGVMDDDPITVPEWLAIEKELI